MLRNKLFLKLKSGICYNKWKEKPISQTFGMVFLVCGIIWLLIILAIGLSGVPTNLDGTTAKIIVVASCIIVGVSLVLLGLFYIIKKPKIKIDGYTAKWLAKEMEKSVSFYKAYDTVFISYSKNVQKQILEEV